MHGHANVHPVRRRQLHSTTAGESCGACATRLTKALQTLRDTQFNTSPKDNPYVEIDVPVSVFATVYAAVCPQPRFGEGHLAAIDVEMARYFRLDFEILDSKDQQPQEAAADAQSPDRELGINSTGGIICLILEQGAHQHDPYYQTDKIKALLKQDGDDVSWIESHLPNTTFTCGASQSANGLEYRYAISRHSDFIDSVDISFYMPPDASRRAPLPENFAETMLCSEILLLSNAVVIVRLGIRDLIATMLANKRMGKDEKWWLNGDYASLTFKERLEMTRRGFTFTLYDVFNGEFTKSMMCPLVMQSLQVVVDRVGINATSPFSEVRCDMSSHMIPIEMRTKISRSVSEEPLFSHEPIRMRQQHRFLVAHSDNVDISLLWISRPTSAILISFPEFSDDHPFTTAHLFMNGTAVAARTAGYMRHRAWQDCGFKTSPSGHRRRVYCYPLADINEPQRAVSFIRAQEVSLRLQGCRCSVGDEIFICSLGNGTVTTLQGWGGVTVYLDQL